MKKPIIEPLSMDEWGNIYLEGALAAIFGDSTKGESVNEYIRELGGMIERMSMEIRRLRILTGEEIFENKE